MFKSEDIQKARADEIKSKDPSRFGKTPLKDNLEYEDFPLDAAERKLRAENLDDFLARELEFINAVDKGVYHPDFPVSKQRKAPDTSIPISAEKQPFLPPTIISRKESTRREKIKIKNFTEEIQKLADLFKKRETLKEEERGYTSRIATAMIRIWMDCRGVFPHNAIGEIYTREAQIEAACYFGQSGGVERVADLLHAALILDRQNTIALTYLVKLARDYPIGWKEEYLKWKDKFFPRLVNWALKELKAQEKKRPGRWQGLGPNPIKKVLEMYGKISNPYPGLVSFLQKETEREVISQEENIPPLFPHVKLSQVIPESELEKE
jgi:hypothetical protein